MIEKQTTETNPQPQLPPQPEHVPTTPTSKGIRAGLFQRVDFSEDATGFHGGSSKRTGTKLALWTWLSVGVDTLIMLSMSCFFVIAFSKLMNTSAAEVIRHTAQDMTLMKLFGTAFFFSFWMYMIFLRGFNGATIGESTCSLRLGQPWQRLQSGYILKVFLRTTLIMATGIILIPLISLALKRDVAGDVTGLKIYSLV